MVNSRVPLATRLDRPRARKTLVGTVFSEGGSDMVMAFPGAWTLGAARWLFSGASRVDATDATRSAGRAQHCRATLARRVMKALTLAFALTAVMPGSVWAQSDTAPPTLLVVGDSLSAAYGIEREAGWVALLAERVAHRAEVVNASISGETTGGGAHPSPRTSPTARPGHRSAGAGRQ